MTLADLLDRHRASVLLLKPAPHIAGGIPVPRACTGLVCVPHDTPECPCGGPWHYNLEDA